MKSFRALRSTEPHVSAVPGIVALINSEQLDMVTQVVVRLCWDGGAVIEHGIIPEGIRAFLYKAYRRVERGEEREVKRTREPESR